MEILRGYAAGIFMAAGLSLTAFDAQAVRFDNIDVMVTAATETVSPGKAGTYSFYIANNTNGTINVVRFRAYLDAGEFAETNPISSGAAATCTRVDLRTIDCSITGGVVSYGYSTFDFAFTSPTSGTAVKLDWDVRFGNGEATNYISTTSTPGLLPTYISLIQNSTTEAKAYIPPTGDNLYTGTAIPGPGDLFTVGVLVNPAKNKVVTAAILESLSCAQPTLKCAKLDVLKLETQPDGTLKPSRAEYTPDVTTTDLDERLVIILRFAAEISSQSLSQLHVYYTPDAIAGETPIRQLLSACPKREPNFVPATDEPPCVASKIAFTKRTAPDPSLIGVVQVELWAAKNGFVDAGW